MAVMIPLLTVNVISNFQMIRVPYRLSTKNVIQIPNFTCQDWWSFGTSGTGSIIIMKSVMMFGRLPHVKCT